MCASSWSLRPDEPLYCPLSHRHRSRFARLYDYDTARFQIEFLCRDAKQFTGLNDCQARSPAKLAFQFKMSLTAVTCAKLEARQETHDQLPACSMASLKRRSFNQQLIDRILAT
jgi:hypothetical protein